ncbi:hypothetical protein V8E52_009727 [Russula decolorans]
MWFLSLVLVIPSNPIAVRSKNFRQNSTTRGQTGIAMTKYGGTVDIKTQAVRLAVVMRMDMNGNRTANVGKTMEGSRFRPLSTREDAESLSPILSIVTVTAGALSDCWGIKTETSPESEDVAKDPLRASRRRRTHMGLCEAIRVAFYAITECHFNCSVEPELREPAGVRKSELGKIPGKYNPLSDISKGGLPAPVTVPLAL